MWQRADSLEPDKPGLVTELSKFNDTLYLIPHSIPTLKSTSLSSSMTMGSNSVSEGIHCQEADTIKMFVGQIPKYMNEKDVHALVKIFGNVTNILILRDKLTGESRGCCFVTFESRRCALEFQLAWHDIKILPGMRHPIQIKPANELSKNVRKLFVGNLDKEITENDIKELFSKCGTIQECVVLKDSNQESKGCAFIIYSTSEEANIAIQSFNRTTFKNSAMPLVVKLADGKKDKEIKRIKRTLDITNHNAPTTPGSKVNGHSLGRTLCDTSDLSDDSLDQLSEKKLNNGSKFHYGKRKRDCTFQNGSLPNHHLMYPVAKNKFNNGTQSSTKYGEEYEDSLLKSLRFITRSLPKPPSPCDHHTPSLPKETLESLIKTLSGRTNEDHYQCNSSHGSNQVETAIATCLTALKGGGINVRQKPIVDHNDMSTTLLELLSEKLADRILTQKRHSHLPPYNDTLNHIRVNRSPVDCAPKQCEGPQGANLFIYHLPSEIRDADLAKLFDAFGTVISTKVFLDKRTGLSKCFGFVSYADPGSASSAIKQMNGLRIGAKTLKVELKKERV